MWKFTKLKSIIFIIFSLNAFHYFIGAYVDFCKDPLSFCVVTIVQKIYVISGFIILPAKLLLYPIDLLAYYIIKNEPLSFLSSLLLYWLFIYALLEIYRKNKVVFFVILAFFASITLGIAFS